MNRLSPLIVRRPLSARAAPAYSWNDQPEAAQTALLDDIKLFATAWLGGLTFFGTLLA